MDVVCPRCAAPTKAENVDLTSGLAKCHECNAVFDFRTQVGGQAVIERKPVEMPKQFSWQEGFDGLSLVYAWKGASAWFLLMFTLFWDGFMAVWYGIAITQGQWTMAAFGVIHLAVGVFLTYFTLCKFVNRTVITFQPSRVTIRTAPLKFMMGRDQEYEPRDIEQVYCEEKIRRTKNGTSRSYHVKARLRSGDDVDLLKNLDGPQQALYIEQEIERTLNIRNVRVEGEMVP
ncbi:MAG: hypothetical protein Q7P63_16455 [Verrucomicrobiota bacterium JB022]|nr:hypothetical protein [Verrucomicrobiota bacterium JB022]